MSDDTESVHGRIGRARGEVTAAQATLGLSVVLAVGFALLFLQDPMAHDALHNFRHTAGVTCH